MARDHDKLLIDVYHRLVKILAAGSGREVNSINPKTSLGNKKYGLNIEPISGTFSTVNDEFSDYKPALRDGMDVSEVNTVGTYASFIVQCIESKDS